jgi:hypothetical protein
MMEDAPEHEKKTFGRSLVLSCLEGWLWEKADWNYTAQERALRKQLRAKLNEWADKKGKELDVKVDISY